MNRPLAQALLATIIAGPIAANCQERDNASGFRLRLQSSSVNSELVSFIARNSEAEKKDATSADAIMSPRQLIEKKCGSYTDDYYQELLRINALPSIQVDAPAGSLLENLLWPACVYIRNPEEGLPMIVGVHDSAASLYKRRTGSAPTLSELERYFGASIKFLEAIHPGDTLVGSHETSAVLIKPKIDYAQFHEQLNRILDGIDNSVAKPGATYVPGAIVVSYDAPGSTTSGAPKCTPSGDPFDTASVLASLSFAKARLSELGERTERSEIVVVDNGFQGVPEDVHDMSVLFRGSPFSRRFFREDRTSRIAVRHGSEGGYWPIIKRNSSDRRVQGHGTHVTGLTLGGPSFTHIRDAISDDEVWAEVVVLNVAEGGSIIRESATTTLDEYLSNSMARRIVNMSISFTGDKHGGIENRFERIRDAAARSLFVVSAGNDSRPIRSNMFPASLGGLNGKNVITVAATDGTRQLASFSSYSHSFVDIAAPGCEIHSWLDATPDTTPLSGTSQATPLVTFAASLIAHVYPRANPIALKNRILVSGDTLHEAAGVRTAYSVSLNIPRSLYVHDDYLSFHGSETTAFLGDLIGLSGVKCYVGNGALVEVGVEDLWSIRTSGTKARLLIGREKSEELPQACTGSTDPAAAIEFEAKFKIEGGVISPLHPTRFRVPLSDSPHLVMRSFIQ